MHKSKISSNLLFHFTKNIKDLISILRTGFRPMTAIEDISFMLPNYPEAKVGIPMVCFTDIPLELADEHRKQYGLFGLGMKKEWGIKNGLNPISYILKGSKTYEAFNHLQSIAQENAEELDNRNIYGERTYELVKAVMEYSGFLKVYSDDTTLDTKPFYDEREWRYLPPFVDDGVRINGNCNRLMLETVDSEEERTKLNNHMKEKYTLNFGYDDIESIILPDQESASLLFYELENDNKYTNKILIKEIKQINN
jgi:hypothetical protein